jgi:hypothetical protein
MEYQDIFKNKVILLPIMSVYFHQIFVSSFYTSKLPQPFVIQLAYPLGIDKFYLKVNASDLYLWIFI